MVVNVSIKVTGLFSNGPFMSPRGECASVRFCSFTVGEGELVVVMWQLGGEK